MIDDLNGYICSYSVMLKHTTAMVSHFRHKLSWPSQMDSALNALSDFFTHDFANQLFRLECLQLWDMDLVKQISFHHTVRRVVALGTLCALELRAEGHNAGYCLLTSALQHF